MYVLASSKDQKNITDTVTPRWHGSRRVDLQTARMISNLVSQTFFANHMRIDNIDKLMTGQEHRGGTMHSRFLKPQAKFIKRVC